MEKTVKILYVLISILLLTALLLSGCKPETKYVNQTIVSTQTIVSNSTITSTATTTLPTITTTVTNGTITQSASTHTVWYGETLTETVTSTKTINVLEERQLVEGMAYPAMTIGSYVYQLGINLYNGSNQTIEVTKVELLSDDDDLIFTFSESDIRDSLPTGQLLAGFSLQLGLSFQIPPAQAEVMQWKLKWYCTDSIGDFIVEGYVIDL